MRQIITNQHQIDQLFAEAVSDQSLIMITAKIGQTPLIFQGNIDNYSGNSVFFNLDQKYFELFKSHHQESHEYQFRIIGKYLTLSFKTKIGGNKSSPSLQISTPESIEVEILKNASDVQIGSNERKITFSIKNGASEGPILEGAVLALNEDGVVIKITKQSQETLKNTKNIVFKNFFQGINPGLEGKMIYLLDNFDTSFRIKIEFNRPVMVKKELTDVSQSKKFGQEDIIRQNILKKNGLNESDLKKYIEALIKEEGGMGLSDARRTELFQILTSKNHPLAESLKMNSETIEKIYSEPKHFKMALANKRDPLFLAKALKFSNILVISEIESLLDIGTRTQFFKHLSCYYSLDEIVAAQNDFVHLIDQLKK